MEQTSPSTPRDMRKEGETGLINGASLMIILLYGLTSHIPPLELIGIMQGPETVFGITITWLLLFSNIYVFLGAYVVVRWLAIGPNGDETMNSWFAGKHIRILGVISLAWLALFWIVQLGL